MIDDFVKLKRWLRNKTFMLTGKLNGMSRAEAKSIIEQLVLISNVSNKLNFLIAGEKPTKKKLIELKNLMLKF